MSVKNINPKSIPKAEVITDEIEHYDLSFKLIIVGDSGVGKSSLMIKAIKNSFEDFYSPTVGFEFLSFNVKIDQKIIKLQIWDTCGQEAYRSLISSFYRNSSLAILVYAINSENSFKNLDTWINDIKTQAHPDIKIFIIANKADLENERKIEKNVGENFCRDRGCELFLESSAKTGFNAKNIFTMAAEVLFRQHLDMRDKAMSISSVSSTSSGIYIGGDVNSITEGEIGEFKRKKKGCCG